MSFTRQQPLVRLEVDDYFLGTDGETIWKVLKKRPDGYVGITNKAGDKVIVKPEHTAANVTQVIFDYDSPEEMEAAAVDTLRDGLGAVVVVRKIEPSDWQMPSLYEMYAHGSDGAKTLLAHIKIAHGATLCGPEASLSDLQQVHDAAHEMGSDHTHEDGATE